MPTPAVNTGWSPPRWKCCGVTKPNRTPKPITCMATMTTDMPPSDHRSLRSRDRANSRIRAPNPLRGGACSVLLTALPSVDLDFFSLPATLAPRSTLLQLIGNKHRGAARVRARVASGVVRLVSLLPSATEIVYALGLGEQLVGVTFECDEPPSARVDKAVVVGGRDTSGLTPREIDTYVRDRMAAGDDLYTLHADALAGLAPDLVLTQDLCRVCALPTDHVADALGYLGCTADVISLDPHTLEDVLATIVTVGDRTGTRDRADELVASLRARLADVAGRTAG